MTDNLKLTSFLEWIHQSPRNGRCKGEDMGDFYKKYPDVRREKMRTFCGQYPRKLRYIMEKDFHFIEAIETVESVETLNLNEKKALSPWMRTFNISEMQIKSVLNIFDFNKVYTMIDKETPLMDELKKKISYDNKELLFENKEQQDEFRSDTAKNLKQLATDNRMTTTHMGMVLAGTKYLQHVANKSLSDLDASDARRLELAEDTFLLRKLDTWTGHELGKLCKNADNTKLDINTVTMKSIAASKSENQLEHDLLKKLHISKDLFLTEAEQQQANNDNIIEGLAMKTPDILFKQPVVIDGQEINWIEAKNSIVDYALSPIKTVNDVLSQVHKYTSTYGGGAILWTKCGFTENFQKVLSDHNVVCFRPSASNVFTKNDNNSNNNIKVNNSNNNSGNNKNRNNNSGNNSGNINSTMKGGQHQRDNNSKINNNNSNRKINHNINNNISNRNNKNARNDNIIYCIDDNVDDTPNLLKIPLGTAALPTFVATSGFYPVNNSSNRTNNIHGINDTNNNINSFAVDRTGAMFGFDSRSLIPQQTVQRRVINLDRVFGEKLGTVDDAVDNKASGFTQIDVNTAVNQHQEEQQQGATKPEHTDDVNNNSNKNSKASVNLGKVKVNFPLSHFKTSSEVLQLPLDSNVSALYLSVFDLLSNSGAILLATKKERVMLRLKATKLLDLNESLQSAGVFGSKVDVVINP